MAERKKPDPVSKEQSARFIETAKRLEVDETGDAFERVFKKILPAKTPAKK